MMFSLGNSRTRLHRRARGVLGILLAVGLLGVLPATSQADAYGWAYWTATWTGGIKVIPAGQLFHAIQGSNGFVTTHGANYIAGGSLCNTSVRWRWGVVKTKHAEAWWSYTRGGCSAVRAWKYTINRRVPLGVACAELWKDNRTVKVVTQCHTVH